MVLVILRAASDGASYEKSTAQLLWHSRKSSQDEKYILHCLFCFGYLRYFFVNNGDFDLSLHGREKDSNLSDNYQDS